MNRKVGQLLFPSLVLADLLAVITAWFLAFFFRFYTSIEVPQGALCQACALHLRDLAAYSS
jgi:uncharacterized membrane protein